MRHKEYGFGLVYSEESVLAHVLPRTLTLSAARRPKLGLSFENHPDTVSQRMGHCWFEALLALWFRTLSVPMFLWLT